MFAVPGIYLTLPSERGNVRFTPLFLSRQLLDGAVSAAQDLATRSVRLLLNLLLQRCNVHPFRYLMHVLWRPGSIALSHIS